MINADDLHIAPDKIHSPVSKSWIESRLNIEFCGPGLYLDSNQTILVIPGATSIEKIWAQRQPGNMMYKVLVWEVPIQQTVFGSASLPPVRIDNR